MPEPIDQPTKSADRRDRRVYVWWGAGLSFLLVLGLFCWLVVGPVLRVRGAASRYAGPQACEPDDIRCLGGEKPSLAQVRLYLKLPEWAAPDKPGALVLLAFCGRDAVPTLVAALEGDDWDLSCTAALTLGALGADAEGAVPALTKCVRNAGRPEGPSRTLAFHAAEALGRIGPAARPAVPAILGVAWQESAGTIAEALGNIGAADKDVVEFLSDCLDSDRHRAAVNQEAAAALGKLGPAASSAAPELAALLRDGRDPGSRKAAVEALKDIAPKDGDAWIQLCEEVLETENDEALRLSAAEALAKIGRVPSEPIEHQIEMLEDAVRNSSGPIRTAAAEALKKIRGEEAGK